MLGEFLVNGLRERDSFDLNSLNFMRMKLTEQMTYRKFLKELLMYMNNEKII